MKKKKRIKKPCNDCEYQWSYNFKARKDGKLTLSGATTPRCKRCKSSASGVRVGILVDGLMDYLSHNLVDID